MARPRSLAVDEDGLQLDQLHVWLLRRAAARQHLPPGEEIADALFLESRDRVRVLLRQGEREGLWQVSYDGARIEAITAADGSWRLFRGKAPALPQRRCLSCGNPFEPAHRYNFLCCMRDVA